MSTTAVPDPPDDAQWIALGQLIFADWHAEGLARYREAGWTLQALVDYRLV